MTGPLRVGLELTVLELDAAGTARAVRGLRSALGACEDIELVELAHPPGRGGRLARGLRRESVWFGRDLPRAARGVDVLHCPVALGPLRSTAPPLVLTVHDLLALEHPHWYARTNVLQQRLRLRGLVRRAQVVITPSAWSRERLLARWEADVRVIPWGVGPPFGPGEPDEEVLRRHGVREPYVLTVGTLQPRKGLEALAAIDHDHQLVVAGSRGWHDAELHARLQGRAVLTGRVSDPDLVALLRGAQALVFASRHEGFGFPPLEAMACGTPVVAIGASAVPEVVGGAAELADPDDPDGLRTALERVLGSAARRTELREAGLARAAELSWARCAQAHRRIYREVAGA